MPPSYSFHLPDIVAPMFLFAIGYAAQLSFQSRVRKKGVLKTVLHFLLRNFVLFAWGFCGTLIVPENRWDILQTLGVAGFLAIPLLFLKPAPRLAIALLVAVAYQMTSSGGFGPAARHFIFHSGQPAPFSILSLLFILISGSCLSAWLKGKPYAERMVWLAATGTILLVAECLLSLWIPFRKGTLCFVLLSTGICAYLLLLFTLLSERFQLSIQPLEALGRNALLCYMLSSVLILGERDSAGGRFRGNGHGGLRRRDVVDLSGGDPAGSPKNLPQALRNPMQVTAIVGSYRKGGIVDSAVQRDSRRGQGGGRRRDQNLLDR